MTNYIVHEMITLCNSYEVSAVNEEAAIEMIRDGEKVYIPKYDSAVDISYAARDARVLPRQSPTFQIESHETEMVSAGST